MVEFRKRERKSRTSKTILPKTPAAVEGFSSLLCLIQGKDFCWPAVVGMRKGTGENDQRSNRPTTPTKKVIMAK